jgi:hypothetical protein
MTWDDQEITAVLQAERLLRCWTSGLYFMDYGWTNDPSRAQKFPDELQAARACVVHNLHDVELVLRDPETGAELFSTVVR